MKLSLRRELLQAACRLAGRVLPERPVGPADGCVFLAAGPAAVLVRAADRELELTLRLAARVEAGGEALLPARFTLAVLRESAADEVSLEACAGGVVLRWPGARLVLESPAVALYPAPQPAPVGPSHRIDAGRLRWAVGSTLFAAGPGSRRYCLEAVLWEAEPDRLRLVATDNRRLAVAELHAVGRCAHPSLPRLLPARGVHLLGRLSRQGEVVALFGGERALFRLGPAALSCRYVDGAYPPWRDAVPKAPPHRLDVPVAGLLAAVRQASVLRDREGARLLLRLEPGRLVLESRQAGAGQARVARRVPFRGAPVEVALDPRFLADLLRCLEPEGTVRLGLTDGRTPALFRCGLCTHVLMPLRPECPAHAVNTQPQAPPAAPCGREGAVSDGPEKRLRLP